MALISHSTCFIFTARKRSLEQGNIFTSVCQEFCSQGCLLQGGLLPGGMCLLQRWALLPGGSATGGGLLPGGCGDPPVTATAADSMHYTGMHSCLINKCYVFANCNNVSSEQESSND